MPILPVQDAMTRDEWYKYYEAVARQQALEKAEEEAKQWKPQETWRLQPIQRPTFRSTFKSTPLHHKEEKDQWDPYRRSLFQNRY